MRRKITTLVPNKPPNRSEIMRAVRSKDTGPEMVVRRIAHSLGYRYRLHHENLPGKPDMVFTKRDKVIFVHGCFWHGHECKRGARVPKENADYWVKKIQRNIERDVKNIEELRNQGWKVFVIWECETARDKREALSARLVEFLETQETIE